MKRNTQEVKGEKITYWRSIENRIKTKEYLKSIEDEFAGDFTDLTSMDRRSMLKVMGASIALSGIGVSCRRPEEKILPYVKQPESITPGVPNFFATSNPSPFGATGILVESHEGRPTKIEGNPLHPQNLGKASIFDQAAILELYDPDRSRFVWHNKAGLRIPADFSDFLAMMKEQIREFAKTEGQGLAFLFDLDLSPTLLRLKEEIRKKFPKVSFYTHEPLRAINAEIASRKAFGEFTKIRYNFSKAKVICTLFADPLAFGPENLKHTLGFAQNRQIYSPKNEKQMNRLYAVEADYSITGANADHRMSLPIGLCKKFLEALVYELHANQNMDFNPLIKGQISFSKLISRPPSYKGLDKKFIFTLAKDLAKNRGAALIVGSDFLSSELISLIHALNLGLGGLNNTFEILAINDIHCQNHLNEPDIFKLNQDLLDKKIDTLYMMGTNPVYTAPKVLNFKESLEKVKTSIHLGLYSDETAQISTWHVPQTHFLEHFGDTRSFDGTISLIQPLILPLHNAYSSLQMLAEWALETDLNPSKLIKNTFNQNSKDFNNAIHNGFIEKSNFIKITEPKINCQTIYDDFSKHEYHNTNENNLELIINFDRKLLDGRFNNNSWLQELPDAMSKINWDNALLMSPKLARALEIKSGVNKNTYVADIVSVAYNGKKIELPVFVMPGLSEFSLVSTLGYGRTHSGEIGNNVGVDLYELLPNFSQMALYGIKINKTNKTYRISTTQEQFAMNADVVQEEDILSLQNRNPARDAELSHFLKNPKYAKQKDGLPENLLEKEKGKIDPQPLQITKPWDYSKGNQWGMVIDLSKCTGCNACVIACQSENNIPVVGKEQVIRGRLMHWIRVDRYFTGDVHNPKSVAQPVPCQHCENAPCEPVCPVAATVHDKEGLNAMTYNRCIGTRYCANNCPFKVRRFNYFDFSNSGNLYVNEEIKERQKTLKLQRNPDVTVRYRGVMEKCTYCTQRIQEAKMISRRQNKDPNNLPDGAVIPACAQTCPAEAIEFGNIIDENSKVFKLKKLDQNYTMLDGLNVRPRTSYLPKLRNPHPDLVK